MFETKPKVYRKPQTEPNKRPVRERHTPDPDEINQVRFNYQMNHYKDEDNKAQHILDEKESSDEVDEQTRTEEGLAHHAMRASHTIEKKDDVVSLLGAYNKSRDQNRLIQETNLDQKEWVNVDTNNYYEKREEMQEDKSNQHHKAEEEVQPQVTPQSRTLTHLNALMKADEEVSRSRPKSQNAELQSYVPNSSKKNIIFGSFHSRLNKWADRLQTDKPPALAAQDYQHNDQNEFEGGIERTGSYDMSPLNEGGDHPSEYQNAKTELQKSQSEDPTGILRSSDFNDDTSEDGAHMIPGSHWTTKGGANAQRKMPHPNDGKGASSDSDYSEAVTLDPSITEVSILTNPTAIRTKESKDSREADRLSDTSSSVFELVAKSEDSPSQQYKAAAPLIPCPLQPMFDDSSQNIVNTSGHASSPEVQATRLGTCRSPVHAKQTEQMNNSTMTSSAMAAAASREQDSEWEETFPPLKVHPPDDPFHGNSMDIELFSDSTWPSFGDEKERSNSTSKKSAPRSQGHGDGFSRESSSIKYVADGNMESTTSRHGLPSKSYRETAIQSHPTKSAPSYHGTPLVSAHPLPNAPAPRYYKKTNFHQNRQPESFGVAQEQSINIQHPVSPPGLRSSHVTSDMPSTFVPRDDYGPSRDETLKSRNILRQSAEPVIKVPEVPPLPSPFDPNYAAIMESRHKMLLSRQRALLHRRANRERNLTPVAQSSGFFGRTHPERSNRTMHAQPPHMETSTSSLRHTHSKTPSPHKIESPNFSSRQQFEKEIHPSSSDAPAAKRRPAQSNGEPWDEFFPVDQSQETFEALTRPWPRFESDYVVINESGRPFNASERFDQQPTSNRCVSHQHQHHHQQQRQPQHTLNREIDPWDSGARRPMMSSPIERTADQPSFYSKIKSTLGVTSEYRSISQSEAVIARITAVRAARMRRFHERNASNLSFRQRDIDKNVMMRTTAAPNAILSRYDPMMNDGYDDPVTTAIPGYRFYTTHDDDFPNGGDPFFNDNKKNDDEQSLSTNSNAVDYATTLAVD
jgi:hypothetical protein